jgi:peptide/nickel transport system permease protein
MRRVLLRWLLTSVPLVLFVSVLTFVLVSLVPGDAARSILGVETTPQTYEALRRQLGLNLPLWRQYWNWLDQVAHGSFGISIQSSAPVGHELAARLPVTLSIVGGAALVAAVFGVGLGLVSAVRGGPLGRALDVLSLSGLAVPAYWFGLVLVTVFAVKLHWFPASGYVSFSQSPGGWLVSLVLPVVTLGFGGSAVIAKQTRSGVLTELGRPYVLALRARGLSERRIVLRHVLRNAAAPVVTVLGLVVTGLIGGTVLVETVFVLPGLGSMAVTATTQHDIPVIQAVAVVFTLIVVGVNLLIEIVYAALDPKVRP